MQVILVIFFCPCVYSLNMAVFSFFFFRKRYVGTHTRRDKNCRSEIKG